MILRRTSTLGNWAAGALAAFAIGTPRIVPAQPTAAAVAKARADSTRYPYTAADIHFLQAMISHHAQAIVISKWAATHGASQSIRILSQRIINAQRDEIALMQRWLRDRLQQAPEPDTAGIIMTTMAGMEHEMSMPGMLTETQLNQLEHARGAQFDRLFLRFMIQHHRGAVTMVKRLFDTYGAGQDQAIFKMASDINTDQNTEIARMQKMLLTLTLGR
jgi:uncharacterized protein (DUF305 family)